MRIIRRIAAAAAAGTLVLAVAVVSPADPALADGVRNQQWWLKTLKVAEAQAISKGAGVIVGVVDSGSYPHPDLRKNLLKGHNAIKGGSGIGQDDRLGHGTKMAALIAAHGTTAGNGFLGIAPSAKILPVKINDTTFFQNSTDTAGVGIGPAIDWATKNGAKVINASFTSAPDLDMLAVIKDSLESDVVIVAGAGNAPDVVIGYPAAADGVLAVGATDRRNRYNAISVKDPKVELCAPGVDIVGPKPKTGYQTGTGTSDATAIVSGAAALIRAKFPQMSAKDVVARLTATADDIGPPGRDDECGFGELNIVKALTADVPPVDGTTSSASPSTPAATAPSIGPTAASPAEPSDKSHATTAVLGGIAGVAAAIALIGYLVFRRRRQA